MGSFLQDVRYACRMLLKTPGFSSVAILTLALGIGANIAAFSIVDGVLLRPLPFPHPDQLVRVFDDLRTSNTKDVGMSVPQFWDYRDRAGVFQDIAVIWPIPANLTDVERPERIEVLATSANYFTMLGAQPALGRVFTQKDEVPGFINAVVLSDGFWRRQFGADPKAIGRSIRLDGDLYQIFGVMPSGFHHPGKTLETEEDAYIAAGYNALPFPTPPLRSVRMLPGAIARLKPGLTVAAAQARLETFDARLGPRLLHRLSRRRGLGSSPGLRAARPSPPTSAPNFRALRRRRVRAAHRLRQSRESSLGACLRPPPRNCHPPRSWEPGAAA